MSQSQARATRGGGPWVMSCSWLVFVVWVVNVRQQLCDRFGEGVTANVVIGKLVHGCRSRRQQDGVIRLGDSVGQLDHVMHDSCTVDNLHCSVFEVVGVYRNVRCVSLECLKKWCLISAQQND